MARTRQIENTIPSRRLRNHGLTGPARRTAADVVAWLGAVQAQEYGLSKWGIVLRMDGGARAEDVERAFNAGQILRTHVMRPTWHFVPRDDIRWMLELTAPRVHMRLTPYNARLDLDAATFRRAASVFERALEGGRFLTRAELAGHLARARVAATGQRLAHLVVYAELERVICSGPRHGTQLTYALLAERAPRARRLDRDEALGTLARRFFRSHGPATVRDFVWWSGLLTPDATRALQIVRARPETIGGLTYWSVGAEPAGGTRDGRVHLLPIYDEYLVAYRDRQAVAQQPPGGSRHAGRLAALQNPLVVGGQVRGSWRLRRAARDSQIEVVAAAPLPRQDREALQSMAARYSAAFGVAVSVVFR